MKKPNLNRILVLDGPPKAIPLTVAAIMQPYVHERMLAIHEAAIKDGVLITEDMTFILVGNFVSALCEGIRCGIRDHETLLKDPKVVEWLAGTLGKPQSKKARKP
jgi:hypothetical protein